MSCRASAYIIDSYTALDSLDRLAPGHHRYGGPVSPAILYYTSTCYALRSEPGLTRTIARDSSFS